MSEQLPIYIDIDGTLTDNPICRGGAPNQARLAVVRTIITLGTPVIIWSARGREYAEKFVAENDIAAQAAIGKPQFCIDDNPTIRPGFKVERPEWLTQFAAGYMKRAG